MLLISVTSTISTLWNQSRVELAFTAIIYFALSKRDGQAMSLRDM